MRTRIDFLNWAPDLEDENHGGLTVADNVVHHGEGYKPIGLQTAGGFATNASIGTVTSVQIRNAGSADNQVAAWAQVINATTAALRIGSPDATAGGQFSGSTSSTLTGLQLVTASSLPVAWISSFEACELADKIFVTAVMEASLAAGGSTSTSLTGYLTY